MSKTNPNDSVNSIETKWISANGIKHVDKSLGLTKREHFAALAAQGCCADTDMVVPESIADFAVKVADALILELNKEKV